ncbi:RNA polymerase sigma-70 factor (ECF subfamily) [Saonia flava]|uniref:RNA polymerase sigma-70 factor (ECF subfamily) n=1 Tax=Saonia flava TaxID=523696 RepID=A0A846QWW8_9FLAO|nr:RNA polymerase sigma factor [Saonia flava]NJB71430.1 RNA polymerase sigma-70 factor (ECF subfamily) [Saonia flava]
MLKVKSGDTDKLGLLYERHKKRLFGFFYNMSGNASLSEDLVQNVFVKILKYKHTFTGEGSFDAWIFKMARNIYYDHFKKYNRKIDVNPLSSIEYKLQDSDDVNAKMDYNDNVVQLRVALGKISQEKREVLVLSKFKEMKFSEIGTILGCSEGAAKVKAHRALKDLKTVFMQMEKI